MKNELQPATAGLDLGMWLGRREAYGIIAGTCSAAEVASLREIRQQNLFTSHARSWDEFCINLLHVCRRTIDDQIANLEEFGPDFFRLSQITRISAETYRAIRAEITTDGLRLDGQVIALIPENNRRVSAAVAALRKRVKPKPAPGPPFDAALERCEAAVKLLSRVPCRIGLDQKQALAEVVGRLRKAAAGLGVQML
jgi:hypothetical protein